MDFEKEFEENVKQLMQLLRKMMVQYPHLGKSEKIAKFLENYKDLPDLNVFFVNLTPLSPEEFDEFEGTLEGGLFAGRSKSGEFRYELSGEDKEFLKRNGIQF